jgi:Ca-activated chloride channel family protein
MLLSRRILAAAAVLSLSPSAAPQSPSSNFLPANIRVATSVVQVNAHVTGAQGAPVTNLAKKDFRIFEDGIEQPIAYFANEETPVSVGFLFDASASMRNKMHQSAEAAAAFFGTANQADEFFLVEFNEHAKLSVPFTTDAKDVFEHVAHAHPLGRTSLLDALHLALVQMKRAKYTRKAIVIVSDGGDNRSRYTLSQIESAMKESEIQVYSMGIYDPEDQRKRTPEEKNGPQLLSDLSEESGGKHYSVDNLDDLPGIAAHIGEELRSQYVISYASPSSAADGKYHKIEVRLISAPELDLRYRRGYYAPAP